MDRNDKTRGGITNRAITTVAFRYFSTARFPGWHEVDNAVMIRLPIPDVRNHEPTATYAHWSSFLWRPNGDSSNIDHCA